MTPVPAITATASAPIPATAGIGLRSAHHRHVITQRPSAAWFEVHTENFFAAGGPQPAFLERVRADYPLSLHGVGLSLGSVDPLDHAHLHRLKRVVDRFEPAFVSEHLSWSSIGGQFSNDLLPLPYTEEALLHFSDRVGYVQDFLGRTVLIENPSSYVTFASSTMPEWEFLHEISRRSGCEILLDINNVYVSARNHGFDAQQYLAGIPAERVREYHLAGHAVQVDDAGHTLLIDTHDGRVCDDVWALYAAAIDLIGARPTLIEWDANLPAFDVLEDEARIAETHLRRHDAIAA
jgi:uncharacterized protein